jgi:hypothetical protein
VRASSTQAVGTLPAVDGVPATCREAWARVTIMTNLDTWDSKTFKKHRTPSKIFSNKMFTAVCSERLLEVAHLGRAHFRHPGAATRYVLKMPSKPYYVVVYEPIVLLTRSAIM